MMEKNPEGAFLGLLAVISLAATFVAGYLFVKAAKKTQAWLRQREVDFLSFSAQSAIFLIAAVLTFQTSKIDLILALIYAAVFVLLMLVIYTICPVFKSRKRG